MSDIRKVVQTALDSRFFGEIEVMAQELINEAAEHLARFIVYYVADEYYVMHSDGKPRVLMSDIYVRFFCKDINDKLFVPSEIEKAMRAAGFKVPSRQSDIPRDADAVYYGVTQNFRLYRVVSDEG